MALLDELDGLQDQRKLPVRIPFNDKGKYNNQVTYPLHRLTHPQPRHHNPQPPPTQPTRPNLPLHLTQLRPLAQNPHVVKLFQQ